LRTIALDDGSVAILLKEKEGHLRIRASIPDEVDVDLSQARLIFPVVPGIGRGLLVLDTMQSAEFR
jgi:hypothetical protein